MKAEIEWFKTSNKLPDGDLNKRYSQVFCLCVFRNELIILCFNHEQDCWDQEDADDFFCNINEVDYWALLPEKPNF